MFKGKIENATAVVANTNIPFTVALNTNESTQYDTAINNVTIQRNGFYQATASLVVTGVAAGNITAQLYANGVAIPEATAGATSTAVTDLITLPLTDVVKVIGNNVGQFANLSIRLSAAATVNSGNFIVERLR